MSSRTGMATALCCVIFFCSASAFAQPPALNQMPSVIQVPAEAQAAPHFDATAATNAYLAQIPADKTARSDAYFEGGYWMILWDFLYGAVIALLLLNLRWSARMRDLAERVTRFKPVHTFVYWLQYLVLTTILVFPLTVYEDYFREHKYGLATQTFGPWMGDQMKDLGVNVVLGGLSLFVLAASAVVATIVLRRAAARTVMLFGVLALITGVAVTVLAVSLGSAAVFFAGSAIAGAGFGSGFQGSIRTVVPLAAAHERAGLVSLLYVVSYLGLGVPAVLAGFGVVHGGGLISTARYYGAAVIALAALALFGLAKNRPGRAPEPALGPLRRYDRQVCLGRWWPSPWLSRRPARPSRQRASGC